MLLSTTIISIHAPLTGSDVPVDIAARKQYVFQSTLPLRGATDRNYIHFSVCGFQSTLPLRGATVRTSLTDVSTQFQSTLPLRGATQTRADIRACDDISIHAPLTGSDSCRYRGCCKRTDFNPRSPYGERLKLPHFRAVAVPISIHAPLTGSDCFSQVKEL